MITSTPFFCIKSTIWVWVLLISSLLTLPQWSIATVISGFSAATLLRMPVMPFLSTCL